MYVLRFVRGAGGIGFLLFGAIPFLKQPDPPGQPGNVACARCGLPFMNNKKNHPFRSGLLIQSDGDITCDKQAFP